MTVETHHLLIYTNLVGIDGNLGSNAPLIKRGAAQKLSDLILQFLAVFGQDDRGAFLDKSHQTAHVIQLAKQIFL